MASIVMPPDPRDSSGTPDEQQPSRATDTANVAVERLDGLAESSTTDVVSDAAADNADGAEPSAGDRAAVGGGKFTTGPLIRLFETRFTSVSHAHDSELRYSMSPALKVPRLDLGIELVAPVNVVPSPEDTGPLEPEADAEFAVIDTDAAPHTAEPGKSTSQPNAAAEPTLNQGMKDSADADDATADVAADLHEEEVSVAESDPDLLPEPAPDLQTLAGALEAAAERTFDAPTETAPPMAGSAEPESSPEHLPEAAPGVDTRQPLASALDMAAQLAADANVAAEALENLKRMLEHKHQLEKELLQLEAASASARQEPDASTQAPLPLPLHAEPRALMPYPMPRRAPPERKRFDVRGFMAGFALSWAFGVVLYLFMTAG